MKKSEEWTTAVPVLDAAVAQKFWTKVDASGGADACWPWTASHFTGGYGCFSLVFSDGRKSPRHASKVAWALINGRWPNGSDRSEVVMHSCDNRSCCNPKHLSLDSNNANMRDMAEKKRASHGDSHYSRTNPERLARGSKVGTSKMKEEQVAVLKWKLLQPDRVSMQKLADEYGVSKSVVFDISKGKWWKDVAPRKPHPAVDIV